MRNIIVIVTYIHCPTIQQHTDAVVKVQWYSEHSDTHGHISTSCWITVSKKHSSSYVIFYFAWPTPTTSQPQPSRKQKFTESLLITSRNRNCWFKRTCLVIFPFMSPEKTVEKLIMRKTVVAEVFLSLRMSLTSAIGRQMQKGRCKIPKIGLILENSLLCLLLEIGTAQLVDQAWIYFHFGVPRKAVLYFFL